MPQDNSISLQAFQGQSPVDNFLSSYSASQQQAQGNEMYKRKIAALDQADEERKRQLVADALIAVPDGDAAAFEQVKQGLVSQGVIDPQTASQYDVSRLGQLKLMSQKWREMKQFEMEQQRGAQLGRLTEAQIGATNRSNRGGAGGGGDGGMKAPAGYQWTRNQDGAIALSPITGGPADPNKLAPGEAVKVRTANAQLDALEQSLKSYISDLDKTTPMGRLISRGPEVSAVETGHTDLLMQMKNLYELGVLNGPDYTLMLKIVEDPTGFGQIARGTEGLKAQTDTVKSIINRSRNINAEKLGKAPAATAPAAGGGEMNWTFDAQGNLVPAK